MYNVFWISNPLPLFPLYTFKPRNIPANNERITRKNGILHKKSLYYKLNLRGENNSVFNCNIE
jgi:hypothetical protein